MRIAIVSNYNLSPLIEYLKDYDVDIIDVKNSIYRYIEHNNFDVIVSYVRDIFLIEEPSHMDYINEELKKCEVLNIPIIDYHSIVVGNVNTKLYYLTRFPFDLDFAKEWVNWIKEDVYNIENPKKVIVVDADNTLWGGEIAEGDIQLSEDGIGKIYRDFQKLLVRCANKGAIICVASKNYEDKVLTGLYNPMSLINEKVVLVKANFEDKYKNIQEMAKELNLGLDSFIFVDDSSREISDIKQYLPEVECFQVPKNIEQLPFEFLYDVYYKFFKNKINSSRVSEYKQMLHRKDVNDLGIKLTIYKNEQFHISRVSEMTMKTNQFNSMKKWEKMQHDNILTLEYEDKFGKEGVIGYIVYNDTNRSDSVQIIAMAMSCRVLARGVEEEFLNMILKHYTTVFFNYNITDKNKLVVDFCTRNGIMVNTWSKHDIKTKGLQIAKRDI